MSEEIGKISSQTRVAEEADTNGLQTQINGLTPSNVLISGGVSYSGTGLVFDSSALEYKIQNTLYTSAAQSVTLDTGDATLDRIDVIYIDENGILGKITGTPAANPSKPNVDNATQLEVTFVNVPAGATTPSNVTVVEVYFENLGTGGGEWNVTTNDALDVDLASTTDPYEGSVSIETTGLLSSNKYIDFEDAPYNINGGLVRFFMKPIAMSLAGEGVLVGFFVGGSLVGDAVQIGGNTQLAYGLDPTDTSQYQLVDIPMTEFGTLPNQIDSLRFFKTGGAGGTQFFLDAVEIQEGVEVAPLPNKLNDLLDVEIDFDPNDGDVINQGRYPYYDHNSKVFQTSEDVNHGTIVLPAKKDTAGTIAKGLPVRLVGYNSDTITVELANAVTGSPAIGFTTASTDNTVDSRIITFGQIGGLDTSNTTTTLNPNGETWAVNDILYLSTIDGGLTNVRPEGATTNVQPIAKVLRVNATGGQLEIFGAFDTAGLPNISEDSIWRGNPSGNPIEIKNNYGATADPTTTDDASAGYSVGSRWTNVTDDRVFECTKTTNGAALWREMSPQSETRAVTNAQMLAIASPRVGQQVFNTTWDQIYTWDGDVWINPNLVKCINGYTAAMVEGNPVIEDSAGALTEVTLSSTSETIAIWGVVKDVYNGGGVGEFVTIAVNGEHNVLMNGNVARGNLAVQTNTAGVATDSAAGTPGGFAVIREARSGGGSSLVKCILQPTERF